MAGEPRGPWRSIWLYRQLTRLLPGHFQRAAGDALRETAETLLREAAARNGLLGLIALWPRLVADLIGASIRERPLAPAEARTPVRAVFDAWRVDARLGIRAVGRARASSLVIVVVLAAGFAALALVGAVANVMLWRPLPYATPERLVALYETNRELGTESAGPSPGNMLDWRRRVEGLDAMAAWMTTTLTLATSSGPIAIRSAQVTEDFFRVFAQPPTLGRVLEKPDFDQAAWNVANRFVGRFRVVVLSHAFWQRQFGGDPTVIGRTLAAEGERWDIVGVLGPRFPMGTADVDVWTPWDIESSYTGPQFAAGPPRTFRFLRAVGRLSPGVTADTAGERLRSVAGSLQSEYPRDNAGWSVRAVPLADDLTRTTKPMLTTIAVAVILLLVLACGNVAALMLARAQARASDFALRAALGASASRLYRPLLCESLLLAGTAAALGVLTARNALSTMLALVPVPLLGGADVAVDGGVAAVVAAIALLAAVAFAAGGAADVRRLLAGSTLGRLDGTRVLGARQGVRSVLVVGQVALALTVLVAAGLTLRSFEQLRSTAIGFDPEGVLVAPISLDASRYDADRSADYYRQLVDRVRGLPGVRAAAAVTTLPLSEVGPDFDRPFWRDGEQPQPGEAGEAHIRMATPGYFSALRIPLVAGRDFGADDRGGFPRVVIINRTLAERLWPGMPAIGRRVVIDYQRGAYPYEVVGVSADTRHYGPRVPPGPEVFIPHAQNPYLPMQLVVRGSSAPEALAPAVREALIAIDPAQPAISFGTLARLRAVNLGSDRFAAVTLTIIGALGLMLAATGLYGLLSLLVHERTREIGVRMALGADQGSVLRLVMGRGLRLTAAGAGAGLLLAAATTGVLRSLLFGVSATDPLTFSAGLALLVGVAALSTVLPAYHATRVDPVEALRS